MCKFDSRKHFDRRRAGRRQVDLEVTGRYAYGHLAVESFGTLLTQLSGSDCDDSLSGRRRAGGRQVRGAGNHWAVRVRAPGGGEGHLVYEKFPIPKAFRPQASRQA